MRNYENLLKFIEGVNPWWKNPNFRFDVRDRKRYSGALEDNSNRLIRVLVGARRVGKTSLLRNLINSKLERVKGRKIIYIPADLPEVGEQGIRATLEIIAQELNIDMFKDEVSVFVDEIQEIKAWHTEMKLLYDNTKIRFYVTGSSSLILRREMSKLTGRFILTKVLPLNFTEFLDFRQKSSISEEVLLEEYLTFGGYPEYVLNKNPIYLQQAVESTLYRELLDYFGIRNPAILEKLLRLLADKITTTVSASRIARDLNIDDKTAKFYLEYLESVYLIYPVHRFGLSHKLSKTSVPKYYFNDTGILSLFGIRPRIGHLIENAVFLKLLNDQINSEISQIYYEVIDNQEIDFRVSDKLFEVKEGRNELAGELEKYDLLDVDISVIINATVQSLSKLPTFPNLTYHSLLKFLKN